MNRRSLWRSAGVALAALGLGSARAESRPTHQIVFHVGSADPGPMHVALGNIANAADGYAERGDTVTIELVANGPGYAMLREGSPVADGVAATKRKYPFVVFAACQRSRAGIAAAEGKPMREIVQLPEAVDVPAGVIRLTELQEQHWAYIRV